MWYKETVKIYLRFFLFYLIVKCFVVINANGVKRNIFHGDLVIFLITNYHSFVKILLFIQGCLFHPNLDYVWTGKIIVIWTFCLSLTIYLYNFLKQRIANFESFLRCLPFYLAGGQMIFIHHVESAVQIIIVKSISCLTNVRMIGSLTIFWWHIKKQNRDFT